MKGKISGLLFQFLAITAFAAGTNTLTVIPLPQKMELRDGIFALSASTRVYTDSASRETAPFLTERLRLSTGYPLKTSTTSAAEAIPGGILLTTKNANTNL